MFCRSPQKQVAQETTEAGPAMTLGSPLYFGLINNLAIFIALVAVYGTLLGYFKRPEWLRNQVVFGFIFGLFTIGSMFAKIPVAEGVIVDQRNAIIVLSGAFGGPIAGLTTAVMAGAFRIHLGGAGVIAGVVGVCLATIAGFALRRWFNGTYDAVKLAIGSGVAVLVILPGFLLVGDLATGWQLMQTVALPYGLAIYTGMVLVGLLLIRENRRLESEALQRRSEERLRDFAESASDWFWELDADLKLSYLSERYEEITGLKIADRLGRYRFGMIDHEADPAAWDAHRADMEARRPFKDFTFAHRVAPDRVVMTRVSGTPVFRDDGSFAGYRGSASDVTAQYELQNQVNRAQKMQAIGQLTGGIAHDFNNLLTVLLGNLELCRERVGRDPVATRFLDAMMRAVSAGSALTHRLLAFARQQPLTARPTDIPEQIGHLEDLLRRTLGAAVELQAACQDGTWPALVDGQMLDHAIVNLALNARDAMPDGGKLTIECDNASLDETYPGVREGLAPGDYVRIAVSDTGSGMPPEIVDRVFEPFFTTKDAGSGSGLGLSMVYGFVKQSGGHVGVYSEVGHGTTISLYLPRAPGEVVQEPEHDQTPPPGGSERILLVEDDPAVRQIPVQILTAAGYTILESGNGADALSLLADQGPVDLLFVDVVLPGTMNGAETATQAEILQPGLKILFTTGYSRNATFHGERLEPGVNLIAKPYRKADLLRSVRQALDGTSDGGPGGDTAARGRTTERTSP